jgi:hypothetical protein
LIKKVSFSLFLPFNTSYVSSYKNILVKPFKLRRLEQYIKIIDNDSILFGREFRIYSTKSSSTMVSPILAN